MYMFCTCLDRYSPESPPGKLGKISQVGFKWTFKGYGYEETVIHSMRCDNAINQSAPFPASWKTAIKVVVAVDKMRRDAIAKAAKVIENTQCECILLGVPRTL